MSTSLSVGFVGVSRCRSRVSGGSASRRASSSDSRKTARIERRKVAGAAPLRDRAHRCDDVPGLDQREVALVTAMPEANSNALGPFEAAMDRSAA
jgi:hypothetical protein